MGTIKQEDIIAWRDGNKIFCAGCGEPNPEAVPLTAADFEGDDLVTCDECDERIL